MRSVYAIAGTFALVAFMGLGLQADEKKETKKVGTKVELKGDLCCAKCELKIEGVTKCANAIKVKEGDKDVVYILEDKGGGAPYHGDICQAVKPGTVTGVIVEKKKDAIKGYTYVKPGKDGVKIKD